MAGTGATSWQQGAYGGGYASDQQAADANRRTRFLDGLAPVRAAVRTLLVADAAAAGTLPSQEVRGCLRAVLIDLETLVSAHAVTRWGGVSSVGYGVSGGYRSGTPWLYEGLQGVADDVAAAAAAAAARDAATWIPPRFFILLFAVVELLRTLVVHPHADEEDLIPLDQKLEVTCATAEATLLPVYLKRFEGTAAATAARDGVGDPSTALTGYGYDTASFRDVGALRNALDDITKYQGKAWSYNAKTATLLKQTLLRLPYGAAAAVAYVTLHVWVRHVRSADRVKGPMNVGWARLLPKVVGFGRRHSHAKKDLRRAAEILVYLKPPTSALLADAAAKYLRKAAGGVPARLVHAMITEDPELPRRAQEEANAETQPGHALLGQWVVDHSTRYTIKRGDAGELVFTQRITHWGGGSEVLEGVLRPARDEGQPRLPERFAARWSTLLSSGGALFIKPHGHHALESMYLVDAAHPTGVAAVATRAVGADDDAAPTVVDFCTRLLKTTLEAPPAWHFHEPTEFVAKHEEIFDAITTLPNGFLKYLETHARARDRLRVASCDPQAFAHMCVALPEEPRRKVVPLLKKLASNTPSMGLARVILEILATRCLPLEPTDALTMLQDISASEYGDRDPLAVLHCLAAARRHDFDGTWDWVDGYNHRSYESALEVRGHRVRMVHPMLQGICHVVAVRYLPTALDIVLAVQTSDASWVGSASSEAATAAAAAALAQDQHLKVGDRVRVRDDPQSAWKLGVVTAAPEGGADAARAGRQQTGVRPAAAAGPGGSADVLIRADGWQTAYTWVFIEKVVAPPPDAADAAGSGASGSSGSYQFTLRLPAAKGDEGGAQAHAHAQQLQRGKWWGPNGRAAECFYRRSRVQAVELFAPVAVVRGGRDGDAEERAEGGDEPPPPPPHPLLLDAAAKDAAIADALLPPLREACASWDARGAGTRTTHTTAYDLVRHVVTAETFAPLGIVRPLFDLVVGRVVAQHFRFPAALDAWVLGVTPEAPTAPAADPTPPAPKGIDLLRSRRGDNAAALAAAGDAVLQAYLRTRGCDVAWSSTPVDLRRARALRDAYGAAAEGFTSSVAAALKDLQKRLDAGQVSRAQVVEFDRHKAILDGNGVEFKPQELLDAIGTELRGMELTSTMLRELVEHWGVLGGEGLLEDLDDVLRLKDITPLARVHTLHHDVRLRLGRALELPYAAVSPILRAHFKAHAHGGGVQIADFPRAFDGCVAHLARVTLDTLCGDAVAGLPAAESEYSEGQAAQERGLLERLGVSEEVIDALLGDVMPLRVAVHGLEAFRELHGTPTAGLKLHRDFFDRDDQAALLLELDSNSVTLRDAGAVLGKLRAVTNGCRPHVFRLIHVVMQCSALVDFVRSHPETQDTGLANVLANARDKQHADFQTYLECCTYINPFVQASAAHAAAVGASADVEADADGSDNDADAGADAVLGRPVIHCSEFFEALNGAFAGGDVSQHMVLVLEDMLLTTAERGKLEALEQLVASKTTTTDALVSQCRTLLDDSTFEITFPPTGMPVLRCVMAPVMSNDADGAGDGEAASEAAACMVGPDSTVLCVNQYKDVVFRATLQQSAGACEVLDAFVARAKDALRVYAAACKVFDEGNLEFRGRRLVFTHENARQLHPLLQAVRGMWVAGGGNSGGRDSLLARAMQRHPALAALTSSELVSIALLLRQTPLRCVSTSIAAPGGYFAREPDMADPATRAAYTYCDEMTLRALPQCGARLVPAVPPEAHGGDELGGAPLQVRAAAAAAAAAPPRWGPHLPDAIELAEENTVVRKRASADADAAPLALLNDEGVSAGTHSWYFEVLSIADGGGGEDGAAKPHLGVATAGVPLAGGNGSYNNRWTLMADGKVWGANTSCGTLSRGFTAGDVVGLHLDFTARPATLHFSINGTRPAPASGAGFVANLPARTAVVPVAVLAHHEFAVKVVPEPRSGGGDALVISGACADVNGVYRPALWTYRKVVADTDVDDNNNNNDKALTLTPVGGRWRVSEDGQRGTVLASRGAHGGVLQPQEVGGYTVMVGVGDTDAVGTVGQTAVDVCVMAAGHRLEEVGTTRAGKIPDDDTDNREPAVHVIHMKNDKDRPISVKEGEATESAPAPCDGDGDVAARSRSSRSDDDSGSESDDGDMYWMDNLFDGGEVGAPNELGVEFVRIKDTVVFSKVKTYLLAHDRGVAVGDVLEAVEPAAATGGADADVIAALQHACASGEDFTMRLASSTTWRYASGGLAISNRGARVQSTCDSTGDSARAPCSTGLALSPSPTATTWSVRLHGNVYGARVGLATSAFDVRHTVDSDANAAHAYWLVRDGTLCREGRRMHAGTPGVEAHPAATDSSGPARGRVPFYAGDVVTVEYDRVRRRVAFAVNGVDLPVMFAEVSEEWLQPVVYLPRAGARADLLCGDSSVGAVPVVLRAPTWAAGNDGLVYERDNEVAYRPGRPGGEQSYSWSSGDAGAPGVGVLGSPGMRPYIHSSSGGGCLGLGAVAFSIAVVHAVPGLGGLGEFAHSDSFPMVPTWGSLEHQDSQQGAGGTLLPSVFGVISEAAPALGDIAGPFPGAGAAGVEGGRSRSRGSLWGIAIDPLRGELYHACSATKVYGPDDRLVLSPADVAAVVVDFDRRAFAITCNEEVVVTSAELPGVPPVPAHDADAAHLVPWAFFNDENLKCRLHPVDLKELGRAVARAAGAGSTEDGTACSGDIIIRAPGHPRIHGYYARDSPVYLRDDGARQMYRRGERWVVADRSEVAMMYSDDEGMVLWTEVDASTAASTGAPEVLRVTGPHISGVYMLQQGAVHEGRPLWQRRDSGDAAGEEGSAHVSLRWLGAPHNAWAIVGADVATAYAASVSPAASTDVRLPTEATQWRVHVDGLGWVVDDSAAVVVVASGTEGDADDNPCPPPAVNLSIVVEPEHHARGGGALDDAMSLDELAVWHILHTAIRVRPKAATMRRALQEARAATGGTHRLTISWDAWQDAASAKAAVEAAADDILDAVAVFVGRVRGGNTTAGHLDSASYASTRRQLPPVVDRDGPSGRSSGVSVYGPLSERSVEGYIVDVSMLPGVDALCFALALVDEARPQVVLECGGATPLEDVRNFLVRCRELRKRGGEGQGVAQGTTRMVITNIQSAPPETQAEIRQVAKGSTGRGARGVEVFALLTDGCGVDDATPHVDTMCCGLRWRRWAQGQTARHNKFKTVTYYAQGAGEGKSYTIAKRHVAPYARTHPRAPVVHLDLDATSTRGQVCAALLEPMRAAAGLLVVHVAHDTDLAFANAVLNGLVFLGKLTSGEGAAVGVPPGGWDMVVELQEPPDMAHEATAAAAPGAIRHTDYHVLAVDGVAAPGELMPFNVSAVDGACAALEYIERHTQGLTGLTRLEQLRALCSTPPGSGGHGEAVVPTPGSLFDAAQQDAAAAAAGAGPWASARQLARAARWLGLRFMNFAGSFADTENDVGAREVRKLIAAAWRHSVYTFLHPDHPDIFHLRVGAGYPTMMLIAGALPPAILAATSAVNDAVAQFMRGVFGAGWRADPGSRVEPTDFEKRPLYSLVSVLATEMSVNEKAASVLLREKGYVMIPDFLQKMVQVSERLELRDTAILQGPSGTGKSFCVSLLADLEQISDRHGFAGVTTSLVNFIRSDDMKQLFPAGPTGECVSDIVGEEVNALYNAVNREDYQNIYDALRVICDAATPSAMRALNAVRRALTDLVDPLVMDPEQHPEICERMWTDEDFMVAKSLLDADQDPTSAGAGDVTALRGAIETVIKGLTRVGRAYMTQTVVQCVDACILKEVYPDIIADARVPETLKKDHVRAALLAWGRDVAVRCGGRSWEVVKLFKQFVRRHLKRNRLLVPSKELLRALKPARAAAVGSRRQKHQSQRQRHTHHDADPSSVLTDLVTWTLDMQHAVNFKNVLMSFSMTPEALYDEVAPLLRSALACPSVRFIVFIDEANATNMMGLVKRITIDRRWARWATDYPESRGYLPENVTFACAVNPHKKDETLEMGVADAGRAAVEDGCGAWTAADADLGFDVQALPPSLKACVIPWRQLADDQRDLFVARRLGADKQLFAAHVPSPQIDALASIILAAHKFVQGELVATRSRSTVSQRDIHRTVKIFDFFFERNQDFVTGPGRPTTITWHRALSSMLLGVATSYYFRLAPPQRARLAEAVETAVRAAAAAHNVHVPADLTFEGVVQRAVALYCDPAHMKLPDAVFEHRGLLENLFVQLVCFHLRLGVILRGAPGTSKTLSNNIIRDNMTGRGEFMGEFAQISEVCRYQGSSQSTADEIKRKCEEAYESQQRHDAVGRTNKRSLLFVDEAGLVGSGEQGRKWGLKVLHYYLEAGLAAVLMTNDALDPAISNRCVEVYLTKPSEHELAAICCGILHAKGREGLAQAARAVVPACCNAFATLMEGDREVQWWFGLRDLFHLMRYLRRQNRVDAETEDLTVTPADLMAGLERNFNGRPAVFTRVVDVFGAAMAAAGLDAYSSPQLRALARRKLEVVSHSLADNNRSTSGTLRNLNDLWVRFKLLVDTTADGCLLDLLQGSRVEDFDNVQVLSLSSLSVDELMPVTVVSHIAAAMESGKTIWLTNTRAIDACLFDVFNQSYQCCTNGRNEVLHFVALAVGATLEYKRVHKNFQAIVHVTQSELNAETLPAPFLNRLEKFTVGVEDVVEHAIHRLPAQDRTRAAWVREKLGRFVKALSQGADRCVYSAHTQDTLDSIVLEAVRSGAIHNVPLDPRYARDPEIAVFAGDCEPSTRLWRHHALRLLQVFRPEAMLRCQDRLKEARSYMRAYFKSLSPTSLRGQLTHLHGLCTAQQEDVEVSTGRTHATGGASDWTRCVVYSPDNVDFASVVEGLPYVTIVSLDALATAERGAEDLQEELYRFAEDPLRTVLVVLVAPKFMGHPVVRELRQVLERRPNLQAAGAQREHPTSAAVAATATAAAAAPRKAVVMLHAFPADRSHASFTPLFATGWDQVYVDSSADLIEGCVITDYVYAELLGEKAAPDATTTATTGVTGDTTPLTWDTHLLPLLARALNEVDAGQLGAAAVTTTTAAVDAGGDGDPVDRAADATATSVGAGGLSDADAAAELYSQRHAFAQRLKILQQVFQLCPRVCEACVALAVTLQPHERHLVAIGKEVAEVSAQRQAMGAEAAGAAHSLAALLVRETDRVRVHVLASAVRLLLEGRNASAMLAAAGGERGGCTDEECGGLSAGTFDSLLASALTLSFAGMAFEDARRMRIAALGVVPVSATPPALPGAAFIARHLGVAPTASCGRTEATRLEESTSRSALRGVLAIIHSDPALVEAFFTDTIREDLQHASAAVERAAVRWVLPIMRARHAHTFGEGAPETVWSIRALCAVHKPFLRDVLGVALPLAVAGVVDAVSALDAALLDVPAGVMAADTAALEWLHARRCEFLVRTFGTMAAGGCTALRRWVAAAACCVDIQEPQADTTRVALAVACAVFDAIAAPAGDAGAGASDHAALEPEVLAAWSDALMNFTPETLQSALRATPPEGRAFDAALRCVARGHRGGEWVWKAAARDANTAQHAVLAALLDILEMWHAAAAPAAAARGTLHYVMSCVLRGGAAAVGGTTAGVAADADAATDAPLLLQAAPLVAVLSARLRASEGAGSRNAGGAAIPLPQDVLGEPPGAAGDARGAGGRKLTPADRRAAYDAVVYTPQRMGDADAHANAWIANAVPPCVRVGLFDAFCDGLRGVSFEQLAGWVNVVETRRTELVDNAAGWAPLKPREGQARPLALASAGLRQAASAAMSLFGGGGGGGSGGDGGGARAPQGVTPLLAVTCVLAAACEHVFLDGLGEYLYARGGADENANSDDAPAWCDPPEAVQQAIDRLLKQPGWRLPKEKTDTPAVPLAPKYIDNVNAVLAGVQRARGTAAMLAFMTARSGQLARVCGDVVGYMCMHADALQTLPADMPFVHTPSDPLHDPFIRVRDVLQGVHDNDGEGVSLVVQEIGRLVREAQRAANNNNSSSNNAGDAAASRPLTLSGVRLVVFFTAGREWLGQRRQHAAADAISQHPDLLKLLALNPAQQALLRVLLDVGCAAGDVEGGCVLADADGPLRKGCNDAWTAVMLPVVATAAALPQSFLHTMALDVESIKDTYIVGDRTGGEAHDHGHFKFDCVTQLTEEGQLMSYAAGQETMSLGACYLLWLVEFGALALQALLTPSAHKVMWRYMFSGDLKVRAHGYQQRMTDRQLLVGNMTERSQTYLLHLGMRVGLSVDEAARLVSQFCYHLVEADAVARDANTTAVQVNPLLAKSYTTRDAAKHAERHVESWYRGAVGPSRAAMLAPPDTDVCRTLTELRKWQRTRQVAGAPSALDVSAACKSDAAAAAPLFHLYTIEQQRLALLPPLLKEIWYFAAAVHSGLSGRVDAAEATQPLLNFLPQCFPADALPHARARWGDLCRTWNAYINTVGPIGYQCGEEGAITFCIEPTAPLSLFLTLGDGGAGGFDGALGHQDIVANAFASLLRVYNEIQERVMACAGGAGAPAAEIDLANLCSTSTSMTLRRPHDLTELCRSCFIHRTADGSAVVDWGRVERELLLGSGVLCPPMRAVNFPVFKFAVHDATAATGAASIESILDSVAGADVDADTHTTCRAPLSADQLAALDEFCAMSGSAATAGLAKALCDVMRESEESAATASIAWKASGAIPPQAWGATAERLDAAAITVQQIPAVVRHLCERVKRRSWETAEVPAALQQPIDEQQQAAIRTALRPFLEDNAEGVLATLKDFRATLVGMESMCATLLTAAPSGALADVLQQLSLFDADEDEIEAAVCVGVACEQYAALRGLVNGVIYDAEASLAMCAMPAAAAGPPPPLEKPQETGEPAAASEATPLPRVPRKQQPDGDGDRGNTNDDGHDDIAPATTADADVDVDAHAGTEAPAAAAGAPEATGTSTTCAPAPPPVSSHRWVECSVDVPELVLHVDSVVAGAGADVSPFTVDAAMVVTGVAAAAYAAAGLREGMQILAVGGLPVNCRADVDAALSAHPSTGSGDVGGGTTVGGQLAISVVRPGRRGAPRTDPSLCVGTKVQSSTAKNWTHLRRRMRGNGGNPHPDAAQPAA